MSHIEPKELSSVEAELDEAKRMIVTAQRAFDMQDAVDIPGRVGELNCLQISKAWLELEKRAEVAEQEKSKLTRMLAKTLLDFSAKDFAAADKCADEAGFVTWNEIQKAALAQPKESK